MTYYPSIITKFIGPTNTRGSRVKASTASGLTMTLGWDHALDSDENHQRAAIALATRHWQWLGMASVISAWTKTGAVHLFIKE